MITIDRVTKRFDRRAVLDELSLSIAPPFLPPSGLRMIQQDSPHGLGRSRVKVPRALPGFLSWSDQLDECLVDQRGGLESVTLALRRHPPPGDCLELIVNDRQ